MKNFTIHPIPLWIVPMMNPEDPDHPVLFILFYIWYIEGAKEKILVDSGSALEDLPPGGPPLELNTIDSGLDKVGLTVDDIDIVIQTHLHSDHLAFASRFPKARIIVQKRELEFARNPLPMWSRLYNERLLDGCNLEVIEGDLQVAEGVVIIYTPGHTPGGQSVSVRTDEGIAIIVGLCSTSENFNPSTIPSGQTLPVTIPNLNTNILEAYDSLVKIKEMADIILPLHDSAVLLKDVFP